MNIQLSPSDKLKIKKIEKTRGLNFRILELYSCLLNEDPKYVTEEMIRGITLDCRVDEEYAFSAILSAAFGLERKTNPDDRRIERNYLPLSVKKLDANEYYADPYYKNIAIPMIKHGDWELLYEEYEPYEAFVRDDILLDGDFSEIPRIGFFSEKFRFPAVFQNGREWMAVKPNEIETMRQAVADVSGEVVAFGLGLGYFAYMTSEKESVKSVTVVEKDENVITLFRDYILPQFAHKEKICITHGDAFEYAEKHMSEKHFDFAFTDLWHDASDGLNMYIKMKKLERFSPDTKFLYWIEDTLLSHIRWMVFDIINGAANSPGNNPDDRIISGYDEVERMLGNSYLKKLACDMRILKI